jgi:hypothetical protein
MANGCACCSLPILWPMAVLVVHCLYYGQWLCLLFIAYIMANYLLPVIFITYFFMKPLSASYQFHALGFQLGALPLA